MHAAGQPRLLDACQNAGMCAAARCRQNDMVDMAVFSLCLRNQLDERIAIGEAAKGIRAPDRDEIRAPPLACQSRQRRRVVMQAWSDYLTGKGASERVIPFRR